jgi:threonine/homoserine/homoserine lactone efflux protein
VAISFESWLAFLATVFIMQLPPGPDSMLVIARGIGQGRRIAFFTALGMTLGAGLVQLPLLALGVTALLAGSPFAFRVLQWLGAAYLLWLGLRLMVVRAGAWTDRDSAAPSSFSAAREGMIATLLNPWPMTFMVAVLPQFIDHRAGNPTLELLVLGLTQKLSGAVVLGAYAFSSSFMAKWLELHPQAQLWTQRIAGAFIIGLAFYMLFIRRQ